MKLFIIILVIVSGFITFLAGVSTRSKEQKWLNISTPIVMVILWGISLFYDFDFSATFIYLMAFGIVIPRLIANIVNQNRLQPPAVFIKAEPKTLQWALAFLLMAFFTVMVFLPTEIRVSDGMPIYDQHYFSSRMGFLFFLIPGVIFMIMAMLQRTAFCSNGLFYKGLLFDWSDFKSYSWKNEWLEIEQRLVKDKIQILIPLENKQAITEFLRMKFDEFNSEEKRV